MARSPRLRLTLTFLLLAFTFCIQALPLIFQNSLTNDEPFEITGGCYYWKKGDVVTQRMQPPLAAALQTLPLLLFTHLEWPHSFTNPEDRTYAFFFIANPDKLSTLTLIPRLVSLLFGLGIGVLLLLATRKESPFVATTALGLWAFDPNLIAHSGIAKSDIPLAFFFMASVLAFVGARQKPGWASALGVGLLTGMTITCKITSLCLFPIYLLMEYALLERKKFQDIWKTGILRRWLGLLAGAFLWVVLIYLPGTLILPDHRNPLAYFWDKIVVSWRIPQKGWAHFYFWGGTSDVSNPWYLPAAFLVKCTIPFLILFLLALFLWGLRKIRLEPLVWIPPLLMVLTVIPASNFGLRMMLPAFPFLYLMAARAAEWLWRGTSKTSQQTFRLILILLIAWLVESLPLHYPNYLSYGNEFLYRGLKIKMIGDADLDWGQDTKRLSLLAKEKGWSNIKLACMAGVDPHFYGLDWQPWTLRDLQGPQPGCTYLIDASFFQLAPAFFPETTPLAWGWISQKVPSGRLGDTWYYFEVPGTPKRDKTAKYNSVPSLRYYWEGGKRVPY